MEAQHGDPEQQAPLSGGDGERYWGSVRFYKHVILLTLAAAVLVPLLLSVVWFCKYLDIREKYNALAERQENTEAILSGQNGAAEQAVAAFSENGRPEDESTFEPQPSENDCASERRSAEEGGASGPQSAGEDSCTWDDLPQIPFQVDLCDWKYLLLNDKTPLAEGFQPYLSDTRNGKQVDARIRSSLERMLDDAAAAGHALLICSAYRDLERQEELVDSSVERYRKKGLSYEESFYKSKQQIALTGTSEHHTGLAVDLVGPQYQSLDAGQGKRPEAVWLAEHAHEYGFILRYPAGKEGITGITYESWHFRYVGRQAAQYIWENDLCLEEFLELVSRRQSGAP